MTTSPPDRRLDRRGIGPGVLLGGLVGVFVVFGLVLAAIGRQPLVFVLVVVLGGLAAAACWYWSAALALKLSGAEPADDREHARLDNLTDGLSAAVGVAKPQLYVIDDGGANAFACGRDDRTAALVVTSGLLEQLSRVELEGVVARELSRIKSGEIARQTLLVGVVGMPAAWSDYGLRYWWGPQPAARSAGRTLKAALSLVCVPLAPVTAAVLRASVGPDDEAFGDLDGVEVTRYPPGLAGALTVMAGTGTAVGSAGRATGHLWIAPPMMTAPDESSGFVAKRLAAMDTHAQLQHRIDTLIEL